MNNAIKYTTYGMMYNQYISLIPNEWGSQIYTKWVKYTLCALVYSSIYRVDVYDVSIERGQYYFCIFDAWVCVCAKIGLFGVEYNADPGYAVSGFRIWYIWGTLVDGFLIWA